MARKKTSQLQNITFSADHDLIANARARARTNKTTLNEEFRNWLRQFTKSTVDKNSYVKLMKKLNSINSGRKFTREEFYEE